MITFFVLRVATEIEGILMKDRALTVILPVRAAKAQAVMSRDRSHSGT